MPGLKWRIGDVEVFQLVELEADGMIQDIIHGATPENIRNIDWLMPHFADGKGHLKALVQGFLIRSRGVNILIDTCNGNDKPRKDVPEWGNLRTHYLNNLVELGISTKQIDIVACTHLHMDHVGWNTRLQNGKWVPTFPRARYLFAREEYEYWSQKPEKEFADDRAAFDDSVRPIVQAGLAQLVPHGYEIDQNVRFTPTPGHTPSHVCVVIESRGQRAIISGDMLHHPCQIAEPTWSTESDTYPDQAVATRLQLLEDIADTGTILIGSHFSGPVAGTVLRTPKGRLVGRDKGRYIFKV